jgi:Fur family transcriptional regulator, ferric uptake regulator
VKAEKGDVLGILRGRGLKATRARRLVFEEIVASSDVHPNAAEIHQRLTRRGERVSLASVYRTLGLLVRNGLVSQVDLGEDHSHYEPGGARAGHGHLICLGCGAVLEFSDPKIRRLIGRVGESRGFAVDRFSVQAFGICGACAAKKR